ncbi:siderophore-interacting protein [Streptomyces sp. NA04227]|uniref:siderophore-interacting protein n=1 Tax=Streptomyces sp. NA04227 TaxID=2742136 RepID=UPI0015913395|nr:siderophore-interacting protein [Streptomyces sp. NA04227]QKW10037.1 siderophore-interacting protein [Streptomyces sp. NA04227]
MGHGWEGAVLKLMRGKDFAFTVTGSEQITENYLRLHFIDGGMLRATGVHPTMWVRLWFRHEGKPHQRAYTLVDPDAAAGTFSLEFALHDGPAANWARAAKEGDRIEATVQGTGFTAPEPRPERMFVIGDPASLPAINSLLASLDGTPATIWFETPEDSDRELPFRVDPVQHELHHVERKDDGAHLVSTVKAALPSLLADPANAYVWIACDATTTRTLTGYVRKELGVPKQRVNALGYWRAAA